jgi:hypothetical protein
MVAKVPTVCQSESVYLNGEVGEVEIQPSSLQYKLQGKFKRKCSRHFYQHFLFSFMHAYIKVHGVYN